MTNLNIDELLAGKDAVEGFFSTHRFKEDPSFKFLWVDSEIKACGALIMKDNSGLAQKDDHRILMIDNFRKITLELKIMFIFGQ